MNVGLIWIWLLGMHWWICIPSVDVSAQLSLFSKQCIQETQFFGTPCFWLKYGCVEVAVSMFERMEELNIKHEEITYLAVLHPAAMEGW